MYNIINESGLTGKGENGMRIVICVSRMGIGGAESHVLTLATELARSGNAVTVVSSGGILAGRLPEAGVRHVVLPLDRKDPVSVLRSLRGLLRTAAGGRADIVHAHGRIPAFVCRLLKDTRGFPPVVTTAHGFWDPMPPKGPLTWWGDSVIAVSEELKDWLSENYRLDPSGIEVIPNGTVIPQAACRPDRNSAVNVTAACRLDPDYAEGIVSLARELAVLTADTGGTRVILRIAGEGSERAGIEKKVAAAAQSSGNGLRAIFTGALEDTGPLLSDTDIFAGSSRSALEAAARGIPVVLLSGSGECGGILSPETSGAAERSNLIPSGGGSSILRESLLRLLSSLSLRKEAGDFARLFAEKTHDVRSTAAATAAVYRKTILEKKGRVLIAGYFGAGNAGDDATLGAALSDLAEAGIAPGKISVIARRRGFRDIKKAGCRPVGRLDLRAILAEMKKSRLFILCGGSLLQDLTSRRSLLYYTSLLRRASVTGCRTAITGGGIGPLRGKRSEKAAAAALSVADHAGLRDPLSLAEAERLAGAGRRLAGLPPALLTADAAASLPVPEKRKSSAGSYFVIAARDLPGSGPARRRRFRSSLAAAASALRAATGLEPVTAAMAPGDAGISKEIAAACGGSFAGRLTAEGAAELLSGAAFSLCVRLHAAVFSLSALTPAISIAYDPKVSSFAKEAGMPCIACEKLTPDTAVAALDGLPGEEKMRETSERFRAAHLADAEAVAKLYFP